MIEIYLKRSNYFKIIKPETCSWTWSGQTLTIEIIFLKRRKKYSRDFLSLANCNHFLRNRKNKNLNLEFSCFIAFWNVTVKWIRAVLLCFSLFLVGKMSGTVWSLFVTRFVFVVVVDHASNRWRVVMYSSTSPNLWNSDLLHCWFFVTLPNFHGLIRNLDYPVL